MAGNKFSTQSLALSEEWPQIYGKIGEKPLSFIITDLQTVNIYLAEERLHGGQTLVAEQEKSEDSRSLGI